MPTKFNFKKSEELRKKKGMTQANFAAAASIGLRTYHELREAADEDGLVSPYVYDWKASTADGIARAAGVKGKALLVDTPDYTF